MSNSGSSSSYRSSLVGDDIEPEDPADASSYRSPSPPPRVAAIAEPPHRPAERVHLPPFWPTRPAAWFGAADAAFHLRRVTDGRDKFSYVIAMLGEDQLVQIADVLEICPPPPDAFERIKQRLIQSHTMDEFQRLDLLLESPALGGQRPSVLLAEMRQLCPSGEVDTKIFRGLFLRRLPAGMRDHLAAADFKTAAEMSAHADLLWDARAGQTVAAVDAEVMPVYRSSSPRDSQRSSSPPGREGRRPERRRATPHSETGRLNPGVCKSHAKYGAKAYYCAGNCSWED